MTDGKRALIGVLEFLECQTKLCVLSVVNSGKCLKVCVCAEGRVMWEQNTGWAESGRERKFL